jgi:hypothetical protein
VVFGGKYSNTSNFGLFLLRQLHQANSFESSSSKTSALGEPSFFEIATPFDRLRVACNDKPGLKEIHIRVNYVNYVWK